MTLLEVAVALAVLALAAGLVVPSVMLPRSTAPDLPGVVLSTRALAIARAQTLALTVETSGTWRVRGLMPDEPELNSGILSVGPTTVLQMRVTALGACVLKSPAPAELRSWDAARCRAARAPVRP